MQEKAAAREQAKLDAVAAKKQAKLERGTGKKKKGGLSRMKEGLQKRGTRGDDDDDDEDADKRPVAVEEMDDEDDLRTDKQK